MFELLGEASGGYQVSRMEHCLQTASRAERDGADEEMVVAALLHDIGDVASPHNHADVAAAILRPYVREEVHWIVRHHYAFQLYNYGHYYGKYYGSAPPRPAVAGGKVANIREKRSAR